MVARQVSLDYGDVRAALEAPELRRQHADHRQWAAHAEAKAAYFAAEACLRAARARRAEGDVGVAIPRLRQAAATLKGSKPLKKAARRCTPPPSG
uniref:BRO1 domain-containing protein n=1 Tax=Oryza glumipatula TaxID=40148 RepID=A0A0E0BCN4_9ORYZ